jgi:Carboxypeptidase regulatory-like domain
MVRHVLRSLFVSFVALLIVARPLAAQEQRGSSEGLIKDASGGVLPGVTVEARSPAMVGVSSVVSDSTGVYRFPSLPPGRFELTASLQGFTPAKAANIQLELGQVLKVDLTLGVGSVAENVPVTGDAPLIDVKQNAAGADVRR